MARMMPDIDPEQIENEGERIVYRELRDQLPQDWVVRFHFPYCKQVGAYLRDGEADFIVVAPGHGLMFLEVKSSHGYESQAGQWFRIKRDGRKERTSNPFEQVCKCKHEVVELILCPYLRCSKFEFPGIYGHAVVYPKGKIEGQLPPSQEPQIIIAYRDMRGMYKRLEQAFKLWGPVQKSSAFTPSTAALVVEVLRDVTAFIAVAAADTDDIEQRIERLTRQQYETYRGLLGNPRALVSGRAGSGKTMLAMWTARELAQRGRTLFLCFNKTLSQWLQQLNAGVQNLEISTFHSICARLASRSGIPWNSTDQDAEFWALSAPNMLADALDQLGAIAKYDAVVVDEGQDFHPNWWIPVELLLRAEEESALYIFYDPDQAIQYTGTSSYPLIATSFRLDANCRNTRRIATYCGNVLGTSVIHMDGSPEGMIPVVGAVQTDAQQRANLCRIAIRAWLDEGYVPSRIAVISPYRPDHNDSSLGYCLRGMTGGIRFENEPEEIGQWLDGKAVWCSTIKSFKGLEADCLIVTDIPSEESASFSLNDLYVAVSRAKHQVLLLPVDEKSRLKLHTYLPATTSMRH